MATTTTTTPDTPPQSFSIGSNVILTNLSSAKYNDLEGIVHSKLQSETNRQQVRIPSLNKVISLKPINLKKKTTEKETIPGKKADQLNISELKSILKWMNVDEREYSVGGVEKSHLKSLALERVDGNEHNLLVILDDVTKFPPQDDVVVTPPTNNNMSASQIQSQADMLAQMNPETLRQQAQMMKSMSPSMLRSMNPQFANMTDQQITFAINQMEVMANNPHMMKMASDQVKNMDPDKLQEVMKGASSSGNPIMTPSPSTSTSTTKAASSSSTTQQQPSLTKENLMREANRMENLSSSELKEQVAMMKSMDVNTLRSMNPMMANMTDEQIKTSIDKFEMMSSNPEWKKATLDQMKGMTDHDLKNTMSGIPGPRAAAGGGDATPTPSSMDPMEMMKNISPEQMKDMVQMMKKNPELLKSMLKSNLGGNTTPSTDGSSPTGQGMSDEQIDKAIASLTSMDDEKLVKMLNVMSKFQSATAPAVNMWKRLNSLVGGYLPLILALGVSIMFFACFRGWIFGTGVGGDHVVKTLEPLDHSSHEQNLVDLEEDEFLDDEF